tara:strand:+ start:361 stop:846 length:486 start_codon:yes stop_codon:yes gene_type:complete
MEKTTWLEEFKKKENPYNQFYKTNLSFINVILIHVNQQQEIVHLKTQKIYITKNIFNKNDFFTILKNNLTFNNKRYFFDSCIQYNFTLNPGDVQHYLKNYDLYDFINTIHSIDDIYFEKTIEIFHNMNTLYFLFVEENTKKNTTRKVYIKKSLKNKTRRKR